MSIGTISASVDGKEIEDLESYRTQSPIFNITLQENNVLGHKPGSGKAQIRWFLFIFGTIISWKSYCPYQHKCQ